MDYVSDAPRLDMHHVIQASKIDNPVEDRSDQEFPFGKENLKPSSPSLPESNKENGHADSCVPVESVECPASDDDEKRAISLEATPHMPSSEAATSVEKVHQEPLDTSTAAANASAFERQLESREPPEAIEQRDGGESNLLDPQKPDKKEPELIAVADRGFESAREAIDQIKECSASVQRDLHEANTEAPETGLITEVHTAGTGDTIDHVPEEPLQTQNDPISIAAKEAATATSDFETHGVEDQAECLVNATSLKEGPSEGGHGSSLLDQRVDSLDVPEPASEVDKQADSLDVPDKVSVIETAEEATSCEADDPKTQADEVIEPSAPQSSEHESSYLADVGEKEGPVADEEVVTPEICSFNESAPDGNDLFEEESAGVEISAPSEVNVREMPCDVKVEDHEVTELTDTQTPAEGISHPLSDEPVTEADLEKPTSNAENDTEISHGIETAIPAIVDDQPNKESIEIDRNPTPAELVKEVVAEGVPLAENDDAIESSCQVELTPAAAQNEKTDEYVELAKSDPTEENVKGSVSSLDESTPTVSDDYDLTKECDKVVEPSTPQILEGDRICHANEPVKEDPVEEPLQTESTPAVASDVDLVQKPDISLPVTEENVSEANLSTSESTPTATKDDHVDDDRPHQLKEGVAEDEKLPVNDRSYTVETTTLSGCDGQIVDQKVSNNQKASEDELKSEAMLSSCDGQSLDQKVRNYQKASEDEPKSEAMLHYSPTQKQAEQQSETSDFETGVSESKGIINLDDAQPCTDSSSPNHSKGEGIELSTLDPISRKVQDSAPPRDQVQDSAPPPDPQAIGEDAPNVKDSSLPLDALAIGEDNTAVKGETESLVTDREPRGIFEKDGAPKLEAEHGTSEPPHKPSFLGKLIDKVTGKIK